SIMFFILYILQFIFFFIMIRLPHRSTLFPYTTLFRSKRFTKITSALMICYLFGITILVLISKGFSPWFPLLTLEGEFVVKNLVRSEEHTSELQSRFDLVCRLLLEKKKKKILIIHIDIY